MGNTIKVCLNPVNPDASSFWDPTNNINLFFGNPISEEIDVSEDISNIVEGINAGYLILCEGNPPENIILNQIPSVNEFRTRWPEDLVDDMKECIKHWNALCKRKSVKI